MYYSVISFSVLLFTVLFNVNFGQTLCGSNCPCFCNNVTRTLDCSSLGLSNFSVCGSLSNFHNVNFTKNEISQLETRLEGCSHDFSHNQINSVQANWRSISSHCGKLHLDLSYNSILRLSESAIFFQFYNEAEAVRVVIDLSFNKIEYLEEGSIFVSEVLPNYNVVVILIDLSFNRILSVHPTAIRVSSSTYIRVIQLLLNNNILHNFTVSSFIGYSIDIEDYYLIDLHGNNISGFNEEDIENVLPDNVTLILDENPWNCDCSQRYVSLNTSRLRRFLNNNNSVEAICEAPYFTKGRQMLSLSKDEFICEPKLDQNANLSVNISAGDTLRLLCPAIGADPPVTSVDWQIPSGSIANGQQVSFIYVRTCFNCYLVINNIEKSLEGVYQCTVSNGQNLTIMQRVMVDDVIRAGVYTTTSASYTTSCDSTKAVKRPLLLLLIILLILVVAIVSLIVVRYKSHKPTDKEIPLPPKSKSETAHNAPGSDRYCDHVAEKESIEDNEHYYLKPDVFKTHRNEEDEVPYVNININHIYVNSR